MCLLMKQSAIGVGILKTNVDSKDDNYWDAVNEEATKSLERMEKYSESATDDNDDDSETLIQKIKNKFRKVDDEEEDDD